MELKDKIIILTGAARIGADVARSLSKKGAKLAVVYLNNQPDLSELTTDVLYIKGDVSQASEVKRIVDEVKKHYGRIDGLIHMAAIYKKTAWNDLSEADWDMNMNVIAKSAFLMAKAAGDQMRKNQGDIKGKIITFSDWSVLKSPYTGYLPYNTAKTAIIGLTKSLAKELAPSITVNAIAPGPILKPSDLTDDENNEVLRNTPMGKWGGASEIAKAVLYLLDSDFVTGQVLYVDGGRSIA
ncbi:MAG TPA: SDR family oxidoreductase [Patescibacteria group bacterium]|jgi:NAD(P)-dependent dehydrogenase (short-subunit alcohol dehydrogenase family)|nr:SDR family oxidoreductase [Patescibacteria group bacterium]